MSSTRSGDMLILLMVISTLVIVNSMVLIAEEWLPFTTGDTFPEGTIELDGQKVGRARHFDEVLSAFVDKNGIASIRSCNEVHRKKTFEILTTSLECKWKYYDNLDSGIKENITRGGTASDGEPTYIGMSFWKNKAPPDYQINEIYLTNLTRNLPRDPQRYYNYLSCGSNVEWVDAPAWETPNNAISGVKSKNGDKMYVARFRRGCDLFTGQIMGNRGTAFLHDGQTIQDSYCQVLSNVSNFYAWRASGNGKIPDYAVVNGKQGSELSYVVLYKDNITHLTYSRALRSTADYMVLTVN